MKRTLLLLVAVPATATAVVAGPALSARPYQPKPVDFELAVPSPSASAARAGGKYTSPVLHAPKRFNTVGLRWRGGSALVHVKMRVRRDGGSWTRWQEIEKQSVDAPDPHTGELASTNITAPAWAGQSDWVQFRASRPLAGATLQFSNTTGTATAADRRLTALRRTVNKGVAALIGGPVAHAAESQPAMVTRDEWGAADCPPREAPSYGEVKAAFIHHTVNLNDYSPAEAPAVVLGICRYHRNSNGWNDIGYNFLVDKYGTIYEGRAGGVDQAVIGAQAQGFNAQTAGIANIGTFSAVPQSQAALNAMAKLIRWKLPLSGAPTAGSVELTSAGGDSNRYPAGTVVTEPRVVGHRDGNQTSCPGDALYAQLPELRRLVGDLAPAPGVTGNTKIDVSALSSVLAYPAGAQLSGRLAGSDGSAIGAAPVELQRQTTTGSFKTIERATTAGDGSFAFAFTPSKKAVVRAHFGGDATHAAAASMVRVVQVRPALTATRSLNRLQAKKGLLRVSGTIKPAKSGVRVVLERKSGKGKHGKVATYRVPVKNGSFKARLRIATGGLYRLYVAFYGDSSNLSATTPGMFVRVGSGSVPADETPAPQSGGGSTSGGGTSPPGDGSGGATAKR